MRIMPLLLLLAASPAAARDAPLLTLDEAKELARQNNIDIQMARERLAQAANLSRKAWAGLLPMITASGSYTRNKAIQFELGGQFSEPDLSTIQDPLMQQMFAEQFLPAFMSMFGPADSGPQYIIPPEQWNLSIGFTWPLLSGPAISRLSSAYDAVELAEVSYEQIEMALLCATSLTYLNLVNAKQQVAIRQRALDNARAHLRLAEAKVSVGEATRVTALRSDVEVAAAEQALIQATNSARLVERALATIIGYVKPDGTAEPIEVERPKLPELDEKTDLLGRAYDGRLDLQGLDLQLDLAEQSKLTTWLEFLPMLVGTGSYSWTDPAGTFGDADTWRLGLALQWNLFQGGLRIWQLDEQQHAINVANLAIEKTREDIATQLHEARLNLESARASHKSAMRRVELAKQTAELVEAQFEVGAATQLDVLDANRGLADAETAGALSELAVDLAQLSLEQILVIPPVTR